MKFNITVVEPKGYPYTHFLFYFCRLICHGLESLGHSCHISRNNVDPGRMNILLGAHLIQTHTDAKDLGALGPYIVYQTEVVTPGAVNPVWSQQQYEEIYVPLLQRARSVWEASPHQLADLQKLGVRGQGLIGGYHPALEEVVPKREKDIDFLFFGSLTPYRRTMLNELTRRGHHLVTMFDAHEIFRNDLIARTKVHLAPRQGATINHLPWGRVCYLANNRSIVALEECLEQEWLQDCVVWSRSEEWTDLCEQTLLRPDREQLATDLYERFKTKPFTSQLARVLDEM